MKFQFLSRYLRVLLSALSSISFSVLSLLSLSADAMPESHSCLNLMPCPQSLTLKNGSVQLDEQPTFYIEGMSDFRITKAKKRFKNQLNLLNDVSMTDVQLLTDKALADIVIIVKKEKSTTDNNFPKLGDDESYRLVINAAMGKAKSKAVVTIKANTEFGALHGLTTLVQLIGTNPRDNSFNLPLLSIDDAPRFPWRGLLIDSVRHFIPLSALKRQLDGMAAAKLNVFHWHLTDDQGWRFESKRYPKLHQLASDNLFYSQQDIKELVQYANELGIRVVPEFDVPGHASAIAVAYPDLITVQKDYEMQRHWGVFEPLLDVSNAKVYQFIDDIVEELTMLFPDAYLHIGGDEVHPKQWQESKQIQTFNAR